MLHFMANAAGFEFPRTVGSGSAKFPSSATTRSNRPVNASNNRERGRTDGTMNHIVNLTVGSNGFIAS
jgi:hypothetical protein